MSLLGNAPVSYTHLWDLAIGEEGTTAQVYVSSVLDGTVNRLDLVTGPGPSEVKLVSETQIAYGYTFRFDPNALVIGPTGLAYDASSDQLYVCLLYTSPDPQPAGVLRSW